ncbi:hypothetical protein BLNAU_5876 [Blattamonas nauphoetae]|uniref:CS domain-containing protein n=1 Tax=Blattamonas nauphoetae TaxID=2049346 RepID=A0ABQ9Y5Q3_9EUKA|nr:hypothetical protein BLNAU_5876 [Blattamonas nauphoetae]
MESVSPAPDPFLTPTIRWAQRHSHVFFTVDLPNVNKDTANISLSECDVSFNVHGGIDGQQYQEKIVLFDQIIPDQTILDIQPRGVTLALPKATPGIWDRLTKEPRKWNIQIDWNHWTEEETILKEGETLKAINGDSTEGLVDVETMQRLMQFDDEYLAEYERKKKEVTPLIDPLKGMTIDWDSHRKKREQSSGETLSSS